MIKVLHVYKTYRTETAGGIEEVIRQISYGCAVHNVKFKVLTFSKNTNPRIIYDRDVEVVRYPINFSFASTNFSFSGFFAFKKLAEEADIIHYHFPCPTSDLMQFFFRPNKPFIVSYHSDIIKQKNLLCFYAPLMHWLLRGAKAIIASSPKYMASSKVLALYKNKTQVIAYGLDKKMQVQQSIKIIDSVKQKIIHDKFFLFVGVLRYYKGLHFLLEANKDADYPIVIAGSGAKEKELKEQAKSLGLKNIIFLGKVSDEEKNTLMQLAYAFVFPSHLRSEAFGISLLEAAMYGKAMISSEIGTGTSYVNLHEQTGLTVAPENPQALLKAMEYLWNNPKRTEEMGVAASKRFEEIFTAERMSSEYAKLYQSLV